MQCFKKQIETNIDSYYSPYPSNGTCYENEKQSHKIFFEITLLPFMMNELGLSPYIWIVCLMWFRTFHGYDKLK